MYNETTIPTKVTESEYKAAKIAINKKNADHWLILADGRHIWVGRDESSMKESTQFPVEKVWVTDEHGQDEQIKAYVFPTSECFNDLDLDALAEGEISWM